MGTDSLYATEPSFLFFGCQIGLINFFFECRQEIEGDIRSVVIALNNSTARNRSIYCDALIFNWPITLIKRIVLFQYRNPFARDIGTIVKIRNNVIKLVKFIAVPHHKEMKINGEFIGNIFQVYSGVFSFFFSRSVQRIKNLERYVGVLIHLISPLDFQYLISFIMQNIIFYAAASFLDDFRGNCRFGQEKSPTSDA